MIKNEKIGNNRFIKLKFNGESGSPFNILILTYSPKELSYGNHKFLYYLKKFDEF